MARIVLVLFLLLLLLPLNAMTILVILIGAILYESHRARRHYEIEVAATEPNEAWLFNIRDMNVELVQREPRTRLAYYELRRLSAARWEMALKGNTPVDIRSKLLFTTMGLGGDGGHPFAELTGEWQPCEESALGAVEIAYQRYNG